MRLEKKKQGGRFGYPNCTKQGGRYCRQTAKKS